MLIAAAFVSDVPLGVVTATAREIAQELGGFELPLPSGFARGRAPFFNILSSTFTVVGGLAAWRPAPASRTPKGWYPICGGGGGELYLYRHCRPDPALYKHPQPQVTGRQLIKITLGFFVIAVAYAELH